MKRPSFACNKNNKRNGGDQKLGLHVATRSKNKMGNNAKENSSSVFKVDLGGY